jgi:hypothetical protein
MKKMIQMRVKRVARNKAWASSLFAVALLVTMLLAARPAHAATFTVDRNDDPDSTTATACTAAANDCSLRGAIVAANANAGPDAVTVPAGTYTLTRAGANEDAASTGDLDVTDDLTITGAGARATRVAGGAAPFDDRIFDIAEGASATITRLAITGGKPAGDAGGVNNRGDLMLDGVAVKNNSASNYGGIFGDGGTLNLTDSTVSGNSSEGVGGVAQVGGTANITNSTISGNQATNINGGIGAGGGAVMNIVNSTIASNTSGRLGGGILTAGPATLVTVKNTIVAGNTLDNCDTTQLSGGTISSQGNNVSSDGSCGFTKPTDKQNTNPRLGSLQNNGGPTDTRALLAGSPAVDAGADAGCPGTDQRGVKRPQGPRCDVGAYERTNGRPVARNDSYRGMEDRVLKVPARGVLRNDTDADGDALRATVVSRPKKGKLSLEPGGAFAYRPARNFNGVARFVYRASDGRGGADNATVTLRIKGRPR